MKPTYPNKIPCGVGDIIKVHYNSYYGEVIAINRKDVIDPNPKYSYSYYEIDIKKICRSTFIPYKKQKIVKTTYFRELPYKIECDSFNEFINNFQDFLTKIK